MIESAFNQLFQSEIVILFHRNRRDDKNSDTEFEFQYDQKFIEFNRKWLKTTGFFLN